MNTLYLRRDIGKPSPRVIAISNSKKIGCRMSYHPSG
jgi:hypothetical protein